MSVDNSELLMLLGSKKTKQTIGKAGQQGFGVGVYGGDPADLTAIGLTPMNGCGNPSSENYGNYIHTNSSVMVFIPAFCYRIGNASAPSYSRDGANALEIRDASEGEGNGWILHRAFIDGGQQKLGFFVDKYLCSKDSSGILAVAVRRADQISLSGSYASSHSMPWCAGRIFDAITLSRARGGAYACISAFQFSALAMLSLAHGQATTTAETCAWYDPSHTINFPKGSNNTRSDSNDTSVTFSPHAEFLNFGKTGSGLPFAKTTHNGQNCGVADVNGCMYQPLLGVYQTGYNEFAVVKESYKMHDFTKDDYNTTPNFDTASGIHSGVAKWGSGSNCVFTTETSGAQRAMCGVLPVANSASKEGTSLFGNDYMNSKSTPQAVLLAAGNYWDASDAGVWYRSIDKYWDDASANTGFRAAGYAN